MCQNKPRLSLIWSHRFKATGRASSRLQCQNNQPARRDIGQETERQHRSLCRLQIVNTHNWMRGFTFETAKVPSVGGVTFLYVGGTASWRTAGLQGRSPAAGVTNACSSSFNQTAAEISHTPHSRAHVLTPDPLTRLLILAVALLISIKS